jgi:DNA-directed RNA polymerase specialized sigma24 family protein
MSKVVSNIEYEEALNTIDYIRIMDAAASRFKNILDQDEIHRCKLIALWDALRTWRPTGRKFTSFLYIKVRWECMRSINQQREDTLYSLYEYDPPDCDSCPDMSDILDVLTPDLRDMVKKRYLESMTLREISEYYGLCHETIRRRLKQAIEILQNKHQKAKNGV